MPILPTRIANQNTGFLLSTHITLGLHSIKWSTQGYTATQGMVKDLYSTANDPQTGKLGSDFDWLIAQTFA